MHLFRLALASLTMMCHCLVAVECEIQTPSGEIWMINVADSATAADVKEEIQAHEGAPKDELELWLDGTRVPDAMRIKALASSSLRLTARCELPAGKGPSEQLEEGARNFWHELTEAEEAMIREQVIEVANSSLARLLWLKSHLEGIESQIDHVHPLRYLLFCFSEEETKVAMRNSRRRGGFVWSKLDDRISHSLRKEKALGNLKIDQIKHMAAQLRIKPEPLIEPIESCDAAALMSKLIELVPRHGDFRRYNM